MRNKVFLAMLFALLIVSSSFAMAATQVVVNSRDWKDVYSGMQYGFLSGTSPKFLVSEQHSTLLMNELAKSQDVMVYSSRRSPFVYGYESTLKASGFNAEELVFNSLSLELARELTNITNYLILDDSYGYNALSVAPYAQVSKSYVLFADRTNINDVVRFLESKDDLNHIIIYGNVDREVRERLDSFNPEIINKDGDRYLNNIEIVKKYKQINDAKQVLLSNGEFIEADLIAGNYPTLFIGTNNVPDPIREYIQSSNIQVGVLIGNELVGTATVVRRQTGISTFVKFARSSRENTGPVAQVEGLDIFRLPVVDLAIAIESIRYNSVTHQLEVTMRNTGDVAAYFKGTYTITVGDQVQVVGDIDPIFIDSGDVKTIVYDLDPIVGDEGITVKAYVIYGESKQALERAFEQFISAERVEFFDDSALLIKKVTYQKDKQQFMVELENPSEIDVFAKTEVVDIVILGERRSFSSDEAIKVPAHSKRTSYIKEVDLSDDDILDNPEITVRAYYGQRENALSKIVEGLFSMKVTSFTIVEYIPVVLIILLLVLVIVAMRKKKRKRQEGSN